MSLVLLFNYVKQISPFLPPPHYFKLCQKSLTLIFICPFRHKIYIVQRVDIIIVKNIQFFIVSSWSRCLFRFWSIRLLFWLLFLKVTQIVYPMLASQNHSIKILNNLCHVTVFWALPPCYIIHCHKFQIPFCDT